jgi:hypothetical protein
MGNWKGVLLPILYSRFPIPAKPSTAADRVHNFDAIVGRQYAGGIVATRHDLAIDFDRDALPAETRQNDEVRDRRAAFDVLFAAVEHDFHPSKILTASFYRPQPASAQKKATPL